MRLLQFFGSHFNATRLGSPDVQRIFLRLLDVTLDSIRTSTPHPMARELRFQLVLFGLKVLHVCTTIGAIAQWRLKEKCLSAALSWFRFAPRWSFGSNILQLKTELRLLTDIVAALKSVAFIGSHAVDSIKSLQAKEQLLVLLLESELTRLAVWVHPLGETGKAQASTTKAAIEVRTQPCIDVFILTVSDLPHPPDQGRMGRRPRHCH